MAIKKSTRQKSVRQEKICNKCGELTLNYTVWKNAILCSDCVPVKQINKIMSEEQMLSKMLGGQKIEKENEKTKE